jgi:hypothetical protein
MRSVQQLQLTDAVRLVVKEHCKTTGLTPRQAFEALGDLAEELEDEAREREDGERE